MTKKIKSILLYFNLNNIQKKETFIKVIIFIFILTSSISMTSHYVTTEITFN